MRTCFDTSLSCDAPGASLPPPELLQSSTTANWPGIIVMHYRTPFGAGRLPQTPHPSVVLELPPGPAGNRPFPSGPAGKSTPRGEVSLIPAGEPAPFTCRPRSRCVQVQILSPLWKGVIGEVTATSPAAWACGPFAA
jgi:hypothetical protein